MKSIFAVIAPRGKVICGRVYRTKRKADAALKKHAASVQASMALMRHLGYRVCKYTVDPA